MRRSAVTVKISVNGAHAGEQVRASSELKPLNPELFRNFDMKSALSAAKKLATHHIKEPWIQRLDFCEKDGRPAMLVSYHDWNIKKWYAVRLAQNSDGSFTKVWEEKANNLPGPRPDWPMAREVTGVNFTVAAALTAAFKRFPQANFADGSLVPREAGGFEYHFWYPEVGSGTPVVAVDAQTGTVTVVDDLTAK
jgi:hypothetical protein